MSPPTQMLIHLFKGGHFRVFTRETVTAKLHGQQSRGDRSGRPDHVLRRRGPAELVLKGPRFTE